MKVALCHAGGDSIDAVINILYDYQTESGIPLQYDCYESPEELIGTLSHNEMYQIYFIDTASCSETTESLKQRILCIDNDALFIEMIHSSSQVKEHFNVCYLYKPINHQQAKNVIYQAFHYLLYRKDYFCRENRKEILTIKTNQIKYFQSNNRIITVFLLTRQYEYYGKLKEIFEDVDTRLFVQINRSNIVNLSYIIRTDFKSVELETGDLLPVSKKYKNNFMNIYRSYIKSIKNKG